jgi:hypothetical protein
MISLELFISSKNGRVSKTIPAIQMALDREKYRASAKGYKPVDTILLERPDATSLIPLPSPPLSYESRLQSRQSSAVEDRHHVSLVRIHSPTAVVSV